MISPVGVVTHPQPCMDPALCQGHADLPERADIDDELECPGEPAGDLDTETPGMFIYIALTSNRTVDRQMRKKAVKSLIPTVPLPLLDSFSPSI